MTLAPHDASRVKNDNGVKNCVCLGMLINSRNLRVTNDIFESLMQFESLYFVSWIFKRFLCLIPISIVILSQCVNVTSLYDLRI